MITDIDLMPPGARVWIYQCNRELNETEVKTVREKTIAFTNSWTAHKQSLRAGCAIRFNRFIILMIDEQQAIASGCSIDSSVHFIQSMESALGGHVSFFDRMLFAFKTGDRVESLRKEDFEKAILEGTISGETIVFNNLVQTKQEFDTKWEVPLKDSFYKQLLAV